MRARALWALALVAALQPHLAAAQAPDTARPAPLPVDYAPLPAPQRLLAPAPAATRLAVDGEGNLLLLDGPGAWLYKFYLNRRPGTDSLARMGGRGLQGEGLVQPTQVQSPNRNQVFVLDYGNRRLLALNVNLQPVAETDFAAQPLQRATPGPELYIYPSTFAVSPSGETFVLNQDDQRIYKFDAFGRHELSFGGLDYGAGRLISPTQVAIGSGNLVYVADTLAQRVQVFNNFGIYQYGILPPLPFRFRRIALREGEVIFIGEQLFARMRLAEPFVCVHRPGLGPLTDLASGPKGLYVLAGSAVFLYPF